MLVARADPNYPGHDDISEWLDGYVPDKFDEFPTELALGPIAARRNAAAKRIITPKNR